MKSDMNDNKIKTDEIFALFPKRQNETNKGDYGRALLLCGSYGMAGAAAIAAEACVLSGIGICEVLLPESIYSIVSSQIKEPIFTVLTSDENSLNVNDHKKLLASIEKANSIVIGCGIGVTKRTNKLLNIVVNNSNVPLIIDADGINCLHLNIEMLRGANCPIILTPHPGEMARLLNCSIDFIQQNRVNVAVEFAKQNNVYLVLKGNSTVIALPDGNYFVNSSGNPGMATGGSGDMLCGILASFCSAKMSVPEAIKAAVHIHGLCGDLTAKRLSQISTSPTNMLKHLPLIFLKAESKE